MFNAEIIDITVEVQNGNKSLTWEYYTQCMGVAIPRSNFTFINDSAVLTLTNQTYSADDFYQTNSSVVLCADPVGLSTDGLEVVYSGTSEGLGIVTIVLSSCSFICLSARLTLQYQLKYRSTTGWMHFNLFLAINLTIISIFISPFCQPWSVKFPCYLSLLHQLNAQNTIHFT